MKMEAEISEGVAHLTPGEGGSLWVLGMLVTRKATSARTGGAYSLFEMSVDPGQGVPPHIQHREDEWFYVLEGEFGFLIGDQRVEVGVGSFVYISKDTVHAISNSGTGPGRVLFGQTPGGLHERFFEEIGDEAGDSTTPPVMEGPPDFERISAVAAKYGIEMLPPAAEQTQPGSATRNRGGER